MQSIVFAIFLTVLRMLQVSAHSLFTGIFFLSTSIRAFGAFIAARDERVANQNAEAMSRFFIPSSTNQIQLHSAQ